MQNEGLQVRILGNQPEPSLTMKGYEIVDFEVRTRDTETFEMGQQIIADYVSKNPELEGSQLIIDDPMTVGLYPSHDETGKLYDDANTSPYAFNELVLKLEALGFYGKGAGYKEIA